MPTQPQLDTSGAEILREDQQGDEQCPIDGVDVSLASRIDNENRNWGPPGTPTHELSGHSSE